MSLRLRPLIPDPERPGVMRVPLNQGRFALIDEADAERVGKHCWTFYKARKGRVTAKTKIDFVDRALHWVILGLKPKEQEIIFNNGNSLDCRRSNMCVLPLGKARRSRLAAKILDTKTGEKNVFRVSKIKYAVKFQVGNKRIYVGGFKTIHEAAEARDKAKIEHGY